MRHHFEGSENFPVGHFNLITRRSKVTRGKSYSISFLIGEVDEMLNEQSFQERLLSPWRAPGVHLRQPCSPALGNHQERSLYLSKPDVWWRCRTPSYPCVHICIHTCAHIYSKKSNAGFQGERYIYVHMQTHTHTHMGVIKTENKCLLNYIHFNPSNAY